MAEPFKNMFRKETVRILAEALEASGPFDVDIFMADAMAGLARPSRRFSSRWAEDVVIFGVFAE